MLSREKIMSDGVGSEDAFGFGEDEYKKSIQPSEEDLQEMMHAVEIQNHERAKAWMAIKAVFLLLFILALIVAIIVVALLYGKSIFAAYIFVPLAVVLSIALLVGYFYFSSENLPTTTPKKVVDSTHSSNPAPTPLSDLDPTPSSELKENEEQKVYSSQLKIVKITVMGPKGSGKSAVLKRYISSSFDEKQEAPSNTQINHETKGVKGVRFEFHEAPTQASAQEETLRTALEQAAFAILTYDMSDHKSFEAAQGQLSTIEPSNLPVLLLGCKSDLTRQVTYEEAEEFATENNLSFLEVSAKNGTGISDSALEKCLIEMNKAVNEAQPETRAELI